ncbi:MAG: hypothetical protein ICV83_11070, partial [Cytophagales bacterium]|nr:hypothetical protein [Cytophagales bacterium]
MRIHSWAQTLLVFGIAWLSFGRVPAYAQFETVQWQPLGPTGGAIKSLLAVGQDIYAGGTGGSVFRSRDKGLSWTLVSDSLPQKALVHDLQLIGTDLYAATSNGVFRRLSGATYWENLNRWPASALDNKNNLGPDVRTIALIGEDLYAGTYQEGLFVFAKADSKWKAVPGIDAKATVWALTGNGSVGLAATSKGVFRRRQNAWARDAAAPAGVRCFAKWEATLYAGADNGVYDLGTTASRWTRLNRNLSIRHVSSLSANGTRLLAGTLGEGRLYRATDLRNWSAWSGTGSGFTVAGEVTGVLEVTEPGAGGFLLAANLEGVSRSGSGAPRWQQSNQGLINTEINEVTVVNDTVYAAAAGTVYRWQGEPTGWRKLRHGLRSNTLVYTLLKHRDRLYCATSQGVYYLPGKDTTWMEFSEGLRAGHRVAYRMEAHGEHLFVLTQKGVYRSTGGGPWQWASEGLPDDFISFERLVTLNGKLYVFRNRVNDNDFRIYRSDDLGAQWQDLKAPNYSRTSLTAYQGALLANFSTGITSLTGVYRSTDAGETWVRISSSRGYDMTSNGYNSLFSAATFSYQGDAKRTYEKVSFSSDGGLNWLVISNATLPQGVRIKAIEATGTHVYLSTWEHGVWMLPLWEIYPPTLTTGDAHDITATTATLTGTAGAAVFDANFAFEYSLDPAMDHGVTRIALAEAPRQGATIALSYPLDSLEADTTYYYRLTGVNLGNVAKQGAIDSFRTHRLTRIINEQKPDAPFIDATADSTGYPWVSVTLTPRYPAPTKVNLWVRGLRSGPFTPIALQPEGQTFRVRLPAGPLDALGLQYYFELLPAPGYGPRDTTLPVTVAVRHPAGLSLEGLDFRNKQYQLLAFPLSLDRHELTDVLGDEIARVQGPQDPTKWRAVTYNKRSDPFDPLTSSSPLQPGVGYFVATTDPVPPSLNTGSGNTVALHPQMADGYFAINLQPDDWTLIGNPFPWDVDWEHVRAFNGNPDWLQFWAFDNTIGQLLDPAESTTLFQFGGGYVKNNSGQVQQLRIPSAPPTALTPDPGPAGEMLLLVNLTLRTPQTVV